MLKDILKIAKQNGITYHNGYFRYNQSEVGFKKYIVYISQKKFIVGINRAVELSKEELFPNFNIRDKQ